MASCSHGGHPYRKSKDWLLEHINIFSLVGLKRHNGQLLGLQRLSSALSVTRGCHNGDTKSYWVTFKYFSEVLHFIMRTSQSSKSDAQLTSITKTDYPNWPITSHNYATDQLNIIRTSIWDASSWRAQLTSVHWCHHVTGMLAAVGCIVWVYASKLHGSKPDGDDEDDFAMDEGPGH